MTPKVPVEDVRLGDEMKLRAKSPSGVEVVLWGIVVGRREWRRSIEFAVAYTKPDGDEGRVIVRSKRGTKVEVRDGRRG